MTAAALMAVDLDRTLIYSRAAIDAESRGWDAADLVLVESTAAGHQSFVTSVAAATLAELGGRGLLVPVTTRTREQLGRVALPGPPPRHAVAANGGVLLVDGRTDEVWAARVQGRLGGVAGLPEALAVLGRGPQSDWIQTVRVAEDLFCYAIVDRSALTGRAAEELASLHAWAESAGWTVSLQGRKLYLVPSPLTKSAAVAELAERLAPSVILAAGDSLLDRELLSFADRAVRPGHGELAALGWREPHVDVLASVGLRAGQEIVSWLSDHADLRVRVPAPHT
jgi:phosphoserine phosphatase